MQSYTEIVDTTTLTASRALLLSNDKTSLSNSSGTTFPTLDLQIGMMCHRTDLQKVYILTALTPTWLLMLDLTRTAAYSDAKGFDNALTLASAATTDIGAQGSFNVEISGATTITSFGTNYNGPRIVRFLGAPLLTYNATSLILLGAANIQVAAGDVAIFHPKTTAGTVDGWQCVSYQRLDGSSAIPIIPGLKNRIINGQMNLDQRNAGAAITVTTQVAALDRFGVANTTGGGALTVQQSTVAGFGKSLKATATAAITALTTTNNVRPCYQVIEAQNCFDLNAKTVTLSFTVETNWTGNLPVSVRNSGNTRSYVTNVAVVSGINTKSVTIPLEATTIATNDNAAGLNIDIGFCNEATFQTATTGSWLAGDFRAATTSTQWCKTAGNFVNVTQLQLEQGAVATAFEQRPIGLELALCQRYYELVYVVFNSTPSTQYSTGYWKVTKRASPTLAATLFGGTGMPGFTGAGNGLASFYQDPAPTGLGTALLAGSAEYF